MHLVYNFNLETLLTEEHKFARLSKLYNAEVDSMGTKPQIEMLTC